MVFVSFDQEIFVIYKINVNNLKDNSLPLLKKPRKFMKIALTLKNFENILTIYKKAFV